MGTGLEADPLHPSSEDGIPTRKSGVEWGVEDRVTFKVTLGRHLCMPCAADSQGITVTNSAAGWRWVAGCTGICSFFPLNKTHFAFHTYSPVRQAGGSGRREGYLCSRASRKETLVCGGAVPARGQGRKETGGSSRGEASSGCVPQQGRTDGEEEGPRCCLPCRFSLVIS